MARELGVVLTEVVAPDLEAVVLVLQRVRQLVREHELAREVAPQNGAERPRQEVGRDRALDQDHAAADGIVEPGDLLPVEIEIGALEIGAHRDETERRVDATQLGEIFRAVLRVQLALQRCARLGLRHCLDRHRGSEFEPARRLDSRLDARRRLRVHLAVTHEAVRRAPGRREGDERGEHKHDGSAPYGRTRAGHADAAHSGSSVTIAGMPRLASSNARRSASDRTANGPTRTRYQTSARARTELI